jgi:alpha-ketoglutarate-dependent taurine dioxygenase
MTKLLSEVNVSKITEQFRLNGFAFVQGVEHRDLFIQLLSSFGEIFRHPDAAPDGVTELKPDAQKAQNLGAAGFNRHKLELHTDRSNIKHPPQIIAMLYRKNTGIGDDAIFVDGAELYRLLRENHPATFRWARSANAVAFNDGRSEYSGPIFDDANDKTVRLRFRADDFGFFPLPHFPELQTFLRCAHSLAKVHRPADNDVVILDNTRWLHGRTQYEGSREVWRILVDQSRFQCGFCMQDRQIAAA